MPQNLKKIFTLNLHFFFLALYRVFENLNIHPAGFIMEKIYTVQWIENQFRLATAISSLYHFLKTNIFSING